MTRHADRANAERDAARRGRARFGRAGGAIGSAFLIAAGAAVLPSAALPSAALSGAAAAAPTELAGADVCEIDTASLAWGVKESFRAYIGSSIANGAWETSNGAVYETPTFRWPTAAGSVDPQTGAAEVAFTGGITFTGHGGLLHLVLADPIVRIDDTGAATLLLDVLGTDTSGEVAVDQQDVAFATFTVDPAPSWAGAATTEWAQLAPVVLTEEGAAAFGGFYSAGDELDPIALTVTVGPDCGAAATASPTVTAEPLVTAAPQDGDGTTGGIAVLVGAVAALAAVVAGAVIVLGRRARARAAGGRSAER